MDLGLVNFVADRGTGPQLSNANMTACLTINMATHNNDVHSFL